MSLYHYSVTQLRNAATCPRIHYFDQTRTRTEGHKTPFMTRVWIPGRKSQTGGGALFHTVVERFNRKAGRDSSVLRLIEASQGATELQQALLRYVNTNCVDLDRLSRYSIPLCQAFIGTLRDYFNELAELINYALSNGIPAPEVVAQLFGDNRRRVDVTFHLSTQDQVHVTGSIDYIFYDWRMRSHRVVDYKLLEHHHSNRDLFQVCAYALMHHHQHGTEPSASVFYRFPKRRTLDMPWSDVVKQRKKVYQLLSSMVGWSHFDEKTGTGLLPPGDVVWCDGCRWNKNSECERRLGPKGDGEWSNEWIELSSLTGQDAPNFDVKQPPEPGPDADIDEPDLSELDDESEDAPELEASEQTPNGSPTSDPTPLPTAPVGHLMLGRTLDGKTAIGLNPRIINTHIAVVGAAGSGKTWTAKVVAEEVLAAGVPVIAIDPQGDLVQLLKRRDPDGLSSEDAARQQRFLDKVETRIFTPGTSHGIRLSLNPIRLPTPQDLEKIRRPERRREEEIGMLQAVANNLVALASMGGEEDSQRAFLFQLLTSMKRSDQIQLRDIVSAILSPDSMGIDHPDLIIKKTEREKLARKLNTFVIGPASNLFSGGVPLELDKLTRASQPGRIPLNVIYLNALTDDDQKHFFLASLASEIYRWMVSSLDSSEGKPNLLFYIDEARDWIPAGVKSTAAKEPLIRLFTQGRKYGVGCLLCTQSPRSVDYNVFGNCSTKIIGRMEAAQDIDRIKDWFTVTGAAPDWIAHRKGAEKGSFVGRWPGMPTELEGTTFKGRVLYTVHEGAWSPDRVEREVDAKDGRHFDVTE